MDIKVEQEYTKNIKNKRFDDVVVPAYSLMSNPSELLGNKLPEHLKSGGIPPFFRVRP